MGLSLSLLLSAWNEILGLNFFCFWNQKETLIVRSISFKKDGEMTLRTLSFKKDSSGTFSNSGDAKIIERSISFKKWANAESKTLVSSKTLVFDKLNLKSLNTKRNAHEHESNLTISPPKPAVFVSPRPVRELDAAATKLQKVYKSYRTRRNLADCAVVVEELWWKALDSAALERSSVTFFNVEKPETAASRWLRARTRAAKVGKGLSKDEKAQKLALQHWLEAIDPRHRYGHNLHFYYDVWSDSKSTQPFFYWLDVGDGKELNLEACSRTNLQRQCINYLGPKEREAYEVIVEDGKLTYRQTGMALNTTEGTKWIFVLSTSRALYVGQKKKGVFQHSSFLSGGATTAAGRLVAHDGILEAIWPYSGHYLPTEDNFKEFIGFLEEHHVDLTNVKRCATDDDYTSFKVTAGETMQETAEDLSSTSIPTDTISADDKGAVDDDAAVCHEEGSAGAVGANVDAPPVFDFSKRLSCKWTSGVGPRIGCVRDYPSELQSLALEQVSLSPRLTTTGGSRSHVPIPSPRPSPKIRLSPRLSSYMGLPSPRVSIPSC